MKDAFCGDASKDSDMTMCWCLLQFWPDMHDEGAQCKRGVSDISNKIRLTICVGL